MLPHEIVKLGIAHIPEGRRVFQDMSVMDNLLMGTHLRKDPAGIKRDLEDAFAHFPVLKEMKRWQKIEVLLLRTIRNRRVDLIRFEVFIALKLRNCVRVGS